VKDKENKELSLVTVAEEILSFWKENKIFGKTITNRNGKQAFTFYEGPPSANGTPGIHHVMARTVKDIFCRFKTMQGYQVIRKGGWDTHGLPVELQVEKELQITKDDIGNKVSVEDYNKYCRKTVMKYKHEWDSLTEQMGYWVDLKNPYITYTNDYIETLWWIIKKLHGKGLLYKGYTIQPYSPSDGTGLSSHELNQPGCYKDVKDTSIVAQFKVKRNQQSEFLFDNILNREVFILAWTTTPWTLPSNTALVIGNNIKYVAIDTFNAFTFEPIRIIVAKDLISSYFNTEQNDSNRIALFDTSIDSVPEDLKSSMLSSGKINYWKAITECDGADLVGIKYEQLMQYLPPLYDVEKSFCVVAGDFVTTKEGTGIVHSSPTFGADDFRISKQYGIPPLTIKDESGNEVPIVDKQGKFVKEIGIHFVEAIRKYEIKTSRTLSENDFYVKNYTEDDETLPNYKNTDTIISIILKQENKAFKVEKYTHSYPHSWRTDKPILYYPLDAWFIKTTAFKNRMVELNKTINWKPESTGTGRFGNWLENLVDWNLSRSRYWGTPIPIWRTKDNKEEICIGSLEELQSEIDKAKLLGIDNKFKKVDDPAFDLHRPFVDEIILASSTGQPMYREPDLIDVWFDSGAMPYAQWHYPFENKSEFKNAFPADYIAEGVDQTRGWFFTLHALAVMLFDSVAFKNVISNGLVLDKEGNKMSKRKGNVVNPFTTMEQFGPDVVRWYLIENAPPWENLKFDAKALEEIQRGFFGTLINTYSFFSLYANIDGFANDGQKVNYDNLTKLDHWILSKLQTLIEEVTNYYNDYEPTKVARALQDFVINNLSNWYVRLNRKRFWLPADRGELSADKKAAYETLNQCLLVVSQLMAPIAPFYSDYLYRSLTLNESKTSPESVHLSDLPKANHDLKNKQLETAMELAQNICSLVHSIRKQNKIKVRIPLRKIMIPVLNKDFADSIKLTETIIMSEVNVKNIEYIDDTSGLLIKKAKPNFSKLGKQYGSKMKSVSDIILSLSKEEISIIENEGSLQKNGIKLVAEDVIIASEEIKGWSVATLDNITVALDITITDELKREGFARDFVNRIQNLRKKMGLDILDKIEIEIEADHNPNEILLGLKEFDNFITNETQALSLTLKDHIINPVEVEIDNFNLKVKIEKHG